MSAFLATHPVITVILAGLGGGSLIGFVSLIVWGFFATAADLEALERGDGE